MKDTEYRTSADKCPKCGETGEKIKVWAFGTFLRARCGACKHLWTPPMPALKGGRKNLGRATS